jgi:PiT family inorganic phosphate transporter
MGLIMLILIGTVPTAYALNRAVPAAYEAQFHTGSARAPPPSTPMPVAPSRRQQRKGHRGLYRHQGKGPRHRRLAGALVSDIDNQVKGYGSIARAGHRHPQHAQRHVSGLRRPQADHRRQEPGLSDAETKALTGYKGSLDKGTRFIPTWVKVAVALALGLGTMVGWKRIVVTVGEKIGKTHLTYAQGAAAEITAMATIGMADAFGLPVSTTHVLSSGVAGTMAANGSGLQASTLRNMALAWILTLPASILLAGTLYDPVADRLMDQGEALRDAMQQPGAVWCYSQTAQGVVSWTTASPRPICPSAGSTSIWPTSAACAGSTRRPTCPPICWR